MALFKAKPWQSTPSIRLFKNLSNENIMLSIINTLFWSHLGIFWVHPRRYFEILFSFRIKGPFICCVRRIPISTSSLMITLMMKVISIHTWTCILRIRPLSASKWPSHIIIHPWLLVYSSLKMMTIRERARSATYHHIDVLFQYKVKVKVLHIENPASIGLEITESHCNSFLGTAY